MSFIDQLHQRRRELEADLQLCERQIGDYQRNVCTHEFRDGWCEKCSALEAVVLHGSQKDPSR